MIHREAKFEQVIAVLREQRTDFHLQRDSLRDIIVNEVCDGHALVSVFRHQRLILEVNPLRPVHHLVRSTRHVRSDEHGCEEAGESYSNKSYNVQGCWQDVTQEVPQCQAAFRALKDINVTEGDATYQSTGSSEAHGCPNRVVGNIWKMVHIILTLFACNIRGNWSGSLKYFSFETMKKAGTVSFPLGNPSTSCGEKCFEWLISPQTAASFLATYWEKKPLIIKRSQADYFNGIISRRTIENYLKNDADFSANSVVMTRNAGGENGDDNEVVSESSLDLETFARMVDEEGWTCQVVHPQQKNAKLHALLERLENWSGSLWGSNLYLRGTTESAPTFSALSDNFELFVLQLDGKCHWKVFEGEQRLSRDSAADFSEEDLGPCVVDETLEPGDLLYIPRGFVHSCQGEGFTYLTLSTYQTQSWCDLISTAVSETLDQVTKSDVRFREGLPINWTSLFGRAIEETDKNRSDRESFKAHLAVLMKQLVDSINIDEIADQFASDLIALRTPAIVRKRPNGGAEELKTFGPDPKTSNDLKMRIRNPAWMRIVVDDEDKILIFSCLDNDIRNHMKTDNPLEAEPTSIEIDGTKSLPGLRELIANWPQWTPLDVISRDVAGELWTYGLLETCSETGVADSKKSRLA